MADCSKSLSSFSEYHIKVPQPRSNKLPRFRLFRFRSPLLTESRRFLFLGLLRCFTSPRIASLDYEFIQGYLALDQVGCPIRKSAGQSLLNGSPQLIAICYVLHRLLAPRHPPQALSSLITSSTLKKSMQTSELYMPIFRLRAVVKEQCKKPNRGQLGAKRSKSETL